MNRTTITTSAMTLLVASTAVWAQPAIPWYTIDGGGGTSAGGSFTLSGTIGQPDVATMSGGSFTLVGGFWSGAIGGSTACNRADIAEIGGTSEFPGNPDGQLTVDDIIVFVNTFSDGTGCPGGGAPLGPACSLADITDIGDTGFGADGQLTVDDIIAFFNAFSDGCP
jgi:hypothetical protein